MARDINLDGAEITIIKTLGLGGTEHTGEELMAKIPSMSSPELAEVLKSLVQMGYVNADKTSFYSEDEFKKVYFQVNPGYSKELRYAMDPEDDKPKSRRVRRE